MSSMPLPPRSELGGEEVVHLKAPGSAYVSGDIPEHWRSPLPIALTVRFCS
jgi:hypothetical protein